MERWMVVAQRADPRVRNPGEAKPLTWPDQFLDVCNRRDRSYTTMLRRKNKAVERIAMLLNLQESLAATDNLVTE